MKKSLLVAGAGSLALLIGASTLVFVPVSCACLTPENQLLSLANLSNDANGLPSKKLEVQLNRSLQGKKIQFGDHNFRKSDGCSLVQEKLIRCLVPQQKSLLVQKGYEITYQLAADGQLQQAKVKDFRKLWFQ
jgi:hypothetical protein